MLIGDALPPVPGATLSPSIVRSRTPKENEPEELWAMFTPMLLSSNVLCAAPLSSTSTSIEPVPLVMTCRPLARLRRNVLPSTSAVMLPPSAWRSRPSLPGETVSVSRNVLSVTLSCDSVPEEFTTRALSSGEFATRVRVNSEFPARLVKCSPASSVAASSPLLSTTESRMAKFVTLDAAHAVARGCCGSSCAAA